MSERRKRCVSYRFSSKLLDKGIGYCEFRGAATACGGEINFCRKMSGPQPLSRGEHTRVENLSMEYGLWYGWL